MTRLQRYDDHDLDRRRYREAQGQREGDWCLGANEAVAPDAWLTSPKETSATPLAAAG